MNMRLAGLATLGLLLSACADGTGGCGPREVTLVNSSSLAVEQLFAGPGAPAAWGQDQLPLGTTVPPGGSARLRLPGGAAQAVRAVWVNGRAAELGGLGNCRVQRVVLLDGQMRPE